jgi:hypothetical protein
MMPSTKSARTEAAEQRIKITNVNRKNFINAPKSNSNEHAVKRAASAFELIPFLKFAPHRVNFPLLK